MGSFYDVLGVDQSADGKAIRKAYLALAWKCHPDRVGSGSTAAMATRMQEVNEAWYVLGDESRRVAYDVTLTGRNNFDRGGPITSDRQWVPFDTSEPEDFEWDDQPTNGSRPIPRWLTMAPAAVFVAGILMLGAGALLKSGGIFGLAVVMIVVSGAGFMVVPLAAMARAERDPKQ